MMSPLLHRAAIIRLTFLLIHWLAGDKRGNVCMDAADVSGFSQRCRDVCSRHFEDDVTDVMLSGDVRACACTRRQNV